MNVKRPCIAAVWLILAVPAVRAGGEEFDLGDLDAELARRSAAYAAPLLPPPSPLVRRKGEAWGITLENNLFAFRSPVANGWSVTHLSADVDEYSESNIFRTFRDMLDEAPWVGDGGGFHDRVSVTVGQEMHTPASISANPPDFTQQPYAGILYLDTMIHTRSRREQMTWGLRLGVVGEISMAEPVQNAIQNLTGEDEAQGWDFQLFNEFFANVMAEYRFRWLRGEFFGADWDLEPIFGGQLGTYAIYANTGLRMRYGQRFPDEFGITSYRLGTRGNPVYITPSEKGWTRYVFAEVQGFGVLRYLPIEGNAFKDSLGADRYEYVGQLSTGLAVGRGDFLFAWAFGYFNDKYVGQPAGDVRYGTITLSWSR